jgi:hypothetical protein
MTALNVVTAVHSTSLSSRCIPAYPEYYSSTTFDATFYTARQTQDQKLVAADDTYTIAVPT